MSDKLVKTRLFDGVLLASTGNITSQIIDVRSAKTVQAIRIKATSSLGNPDFKIDMAVGDYMPNPSQPVWVTLPQTNMDNFNRSILVAYSATFGTSQDWQVIPLPAPFAGVVQFKITGIGSNPADTVITAKLELQESL